MSKLSQMFKEVNEGTKPRRVKRNRNSKRNVREGRINESYRIEFSNDNRNLKDYIRYTMNHLTQTWNLKYNDPTKSEGSDMINLSFHGAEAVTLANGGRRIALFGSFLTQNDEVRLDIYWDRWGDTFDGEIDFHMKSDRRINSNFTKMLSNTNSMDYGDFGQVTSFFDKYSKQIKKKVESVWK